MRISDWSSDVCSSDLTGVALEARDPRAIIPGLRDEWTRAVWEPSCTYIDVAGLHAAVLATARRHGAVLAAGAALESATYEGHWRIATRGGAHEADILVDAAGAWADEIGRAHG